MDIGSASCGQLSQDPLLMNSILSHHAVRSIQALGRLSISQGDQLWFPKVEKYHCLHHTFPHCVEKSREPVECERMAAVFILLPLAFLAEG